MELFLKSGRFLLAVPMVIFGVLHFIYAGFVATIVPPWVPWHLFWTYFAGVALIAAGVSIIVRKHAHLAATLLGTIIFLWVLMIHVFLIFHKPGDPWADRSMFGDFPGRLHNAFKDLGLSGASFICAGTLIETWQIPGADKLSAFGRILFGLSMTAFGVLHFVYPAFAPGIPPMSASVPFPIPGHLFWVYLTGVAFLAAGASILVNQKTRFAAIWLGITILVFDVLTWAPRFAANPSDLYGNWLKDLGLAGGALILASSLSEEKQTPESDTRLREIKAA